MTESDNVSVEDRLRAYGEVLENQIGGAPSTDLVARQSTSGWRRGFAVAAAAIVVAVGGLGLTWSLDRMEVNTTASEAPSDTDVTESDSPEDEPASGQDPSSAVEPEALAGIEPAPDPDTFTGVDACIAYVEDHRDGTRQGIAPDLTGLFDPRTATEEVVVLALPDLPLLVEVLLLGDGGFFSCRTNRDGKAVHDVGLSPIDPFQPIEADEIELLQERSSGTSDGGTNPVDLKGPGDIEVVGRVGTDVAAVWIELADGTPHPGLVDADRWFTIDGRIPPDVPLDQERYYWRLNDGTVHSAPADRIRGETEWERCASTLGCIEIRLAELQAQAALDGLDQQAEALADGQIDDTEVREATSAMVDCLNEGGVAAELLADGTTYSIPVGAGFSSQDSVRQDCDHRFLDLVNELRALRSAEALLAEE